MLQRGIKFKAEHNTLTIELTGGFSEMTKRELTQAQYDLIDWQIRPENAWLLQVQAVGSDVSS